MMEPHSIFELFIWFIIYSFLGWLWEEIICSIQARKLVSRGFMSGPYCPIYGTGALLYLILMHFTTRPVELFFLGGILACTLEYITSYLMEKLFKARWWDYSKKLLNINGRVCLIGFIAFGTFAVAFPYIHAFVGSVTAKIPGFIVVIAALTLACAMLGDLITTIFSVLKLNKALANYEKALEKHKLVQLIRHSKKSFELQIGEMRKNRQKVLSYHQRRLIKAFPNLQSRYENAYKDFKKTLEKKK